MDIKEEKKKEKNRIGADGSEQIGSENTEEEFIKITVSKKSEKLISDLLVRVNDGFEGGRLSRQDLVSWALAKYSETCSDQEIKAIRADHFDEMMLLELSLKRFKQAGGLPPELRKLLIAQAGIEDFGRKKIKKTADNKVNQ